MNPGITLRAIATVLPLLFFMASANAAPYIPTDGNQVLEHLPSRNDPAQAEFKRMRAELAANPTDMNLATALARRYIERSRNEGDPRYLGYAQAALTPWWKMPQPPIPVLVLRATLLQSTHQFDKSLLDLDSVLKLDRGNGQAWITRATILQVQGKYLEASRSCEHLYQLAPELITLTCLNNIANLDGQAEKSYTQLRDALVNSHESNPDIQIWVLTLLAEMAERLGNTATAEAHFRQAMKLEDPDTYLLGAYADFLLDHQRPAEVLPLLKNKTRVDALLLRYALALKALNSAEAAIQTEVLKQRFDAAMLRGDTVHQREQSRFELHLRNNSQAALKIAQLNWMVQKEPADVRVLLEAAAAANDKAAAKPILDWLQQTHMEYAALKPLINKLSTGS